MMELFNFFYYGGRRIELGDVLAIYLNKSTYDYLPLSYLMISFFFDIHFRSLFSFIAYHLL